MLVLVFFCVPDKAQPLSVVVVLEQSVGHLFASSETTAIFPDRLIKQRRASTNLVSSGPDLPTALDNPQTRSSKVTGRSRKTAGCQPGILSMAPGGQVGKRQEAKEA